MTNGLFGMDVGASRGLASIVATWSARGEDIRALIADAEVLADIPTGVAARIDEIGSDGAAMAAAIRRAADALASFTIRLDSPHSIATAVADVRSFRGRDNDPELDRRLGVLRALVQRATGSDDEAARVMSMLLAADKSVHGSGRTMHGVAAVMRHIESLNQAEATGAISGNDERIDTAIDLLRTALADHAASDDQLNELVAAFLADRNRTAAPTLLASVVSGRSPAVVEFAHANGFDYDVAAGLLDMHKIEQLTTAIKTAPLPEIEELERQRAELFAGLAGTNDPALLDQVARQVDQGVPVIQAFPAAFAERAQAERLEQVEIVASEFEIDNSAAAVQLDELTESVNGLVASGWDIEDAAQTVTMAAKGGFDLAQIESLARDRNMPLVDAAAEAAHAQVFAMTLDEYRTFTDLEKYFDRFDTVIEGTADNVVSLEDLRFVVNNADQFDDDEFVLAAAALLSASELRHRLDSAATNGDVVTHRPFGADRAADNRISRSDINLFRHKQQVNFVLQDRVLEIDVAAQGGSPDRADLKLSEADFEHVLANAADYGLTPAEINAVEVVLEADWYDKTFMQEHGDSLILAAAVVAGGVLFFATGGVGAGLSATLISSAVATAGGAAFGAGITVAENLLTDDPWSEDLVQNTAAGATGGLAGAGLVGGVHGLVGAESLAVRVISVVGLEADVLGLTAAGLLDPVLDPFMDDIDLADTRRDAQTWSYLAGGATILGGAGLSVGGRINANNLDEALSTTRSTNFGNHGGEFVDDGVAGLAAPLPDVPAVVSTDSFVRPAVLREELAEALEFAAVQSDGALVGVGQRSTGVLLDASSAELADDD